MSTVQKPSCRSAQQVLMEGRELVEPALRAAIGQVPAATQRVISYHFGWTDDNGAPLRTDAGQSIPPALALLGCQAAGAAPATAVPSAVGVELVHNFSLLHDDVMDGDTTRRHRPTAWSVFGPGPAILAGDALLSLASGVLLNSEHRRSVEAARLLELAVQQLIDGQFADLDFETHGAVRLAECESMALAETGTLLGCSGAALVVLFGGGTADQVDRLRSFGENVGLAYQHVDDLLGIWGDPERTGKPAHSGLRRRTKSLPVVAALTSGTAAGEELAILYQDKRDLTPEQLARMAHLVELAGGRRASETAADSGRSNGTSRAAAAPTVSARAPIRRASSAASAAASASLRRRRVGVRDQRDPDYRGPEIVIADYPGWHPAERLERTHMPVQEQQLRLCEDGGSLRDAAGRVLVRCCF